MGYRKFFWKEVRSKVNRKKVENCSRIKDGNGRLTMGEDEFTREMVKDEGDMVIDWILRLCNMVFGSSVVPEG